MATRHTLILSLCALFLGGCAIKDEVEDGLWEIRSKVSRAELNPAGADGPEVDFSYEYLLGIVDAEGIAEVGWRYALVEPDGDGSGVELASETQVMRQPQDAETEIFVQGERPRKLKLPEINLAAEVTYVLRISVYYRDTTLTEVLVPLQLGQVYLNDSDYGDIPQLSTR